jgi:hypothetical protein
LRHGLGRSLQIAGTDQANDAVPQVLAIEQDEDYEDHHYTGFGNGTKQRPNHMSD